MRLICPNCGAEYEVPVEVVPTTGRDVQCSNCGDTWFQHHPDHMPDDLVDQQARAADYADEQAQASPAPGSFAEDQDDFDDGWSADDDLSDDGLGDGADDETDVDMPVPEEHQPLRRRPLKPEVKSILQEEAEYEGRVRQGDPLESQPELGLSAPIPAPPLRESVAESRLARVRQNEIAKEPPKAKPADEPAPRRELLPDIEEINSTLRRKGETMRRPEGRASRSKAKQKKSGFRRGFFSILILAIVAAVIYLQAPKIATAIPQLSNAMTTYVTNVDKARLWLDEKATILAEKLDVMSEGVAPTDAGN